MLNGLRIIAERRISEWVENGELNIENWKGKPLPQEDESMIPPDLRMAFKILKNSGFLPPEIEARKEIERLEDLIASTEDEHVRVKQLKKLDFLLLELRTKHQKSVRFEQYEDYYRKVTERMRVANKKKKTK